MSEVKASVELVNVRACLLNVVAENLTESRLKQVERRVVAHDACASFRINGSRYGVTHTENTLIYITDMEIDTVGFLGIYYVSLLVSRKDKALVTDLTAAFTVEGSLVKDNGAFALADLINKRILSDDSNYLSIGRCVTVANELRLFKI